MSPQDRAELLKKAPRNGWVALSADEEKIVASGKTFSKTVENARKVGESEPVLIHIPDKWVPTVV